ncbi:MAG: hypothetical protein ATN35_02600 [Epulopiscium sp. Nele67-Bin004]|nr:MAG: hypothetical protein ATN35_02600 [Epulopiscium sp. Nele67-Bin004]
MVYTLNQIQSMTIPVFKANGIVKAIIFGSYAKGIATEDSDIDICIDSQGKLKGLDFIGLSEDIRKKLQKEVDLIDITHIDNNSKVEQEIKNTGVIIYEV